jgi:uncharacterized protein YndB with AHSA1/START domain
MGTTDKTNITIKSMIQTSVDLVWKMWTTPEEIQKWNYASDDWHCPYVDNDLRVGGRFTSRMEAKDGSAGFDFTGVYEKVIVNELIDYDMEDGRKVNTLFIARDNNTEVIETFEAENVNSVEMQREGWQAILDNFKKLVENNK